MKTKLKIVNWKDYCMFVQECSEIARNIYCLRIDTILLELK